MRGAGPNVLSLCDDEFAAGFSTARSASLRRCTALRYALPGVLEGETPCPRTASICGFC